MAPRHFSHFALVLSFCSAVFAISEGCKKPPKEGGSGEGSIALSAAQLNPDGTISVEGMQSIEAEAGHETLVVNFIRTQLSDAGLQQLDRFKNLRSVRAIGSRVTNDGIAKLKRALPEVQVTK